MVTRIDWKNCQKHWAVSTMGINFGTLLPYLLFYVIKGSSAQTDHDVVTYTTKSVVKLGCSFTSTIVLWTEQQDDGNIINLFFYDVTRELAQKQTNDSKYDNFNYLIEGTNGFNLVINNVDKGDGGRYQCNPITSSVVTFDVTVEVLPESISIDCTESNCMPFDGREAVPQMNCVCTATGLSSSELEMKWEGVDVSTASNTARVINPSSGSFNISSNLTFQPPDGTFSLSCLLTGYRSQVPESLLRSSTNTFSPPVCNLEHVCLSDGTSASLICSCSNGFPKVKAYSFYNSQKLPIGKQCTNSKSVQVDANKMEVFYCSGQNGVHNQLVEHEFNCKQGSEWLIFVVIVLLFIVVAAIIFLVAKKCGKKNRIPKPGVAVKPIQKPEGAGVTAPLLYENTSVKDQQKVQGPGGMNPEPSKGSPATKKDDKGMNTEPARSGPAPKKDNKGMNPEPARSGPAPKKDNKLETGGSGLETKDNRNTEQFEEGGSGVDPEDYKKTNDTTTNENSEQAIPLSPITPGDGEPDHAPGFKESTNRIAPGENPAGQQESHDKNGAAAPQEADTTNNPTSTQRSGHHSVSATPEQIKCYSRM